LIFIAYGSGMLCLYFSLGAPQSNLITTSTNISKRHFISCRIFGPLLCFSMMLNLQTIYPDMLHLSTQSLSFVLKWIFNFMIFFYFNIPRFTSSSCIYSPRLYFAIFKTQLHLIFVVCKTLPKFKTETLDL